MQTESTVSDDFAFWAQVIIIFIIDLPASDFGFGSWMYWSALMQMYQSYII